MASKYDPDTAKLAGENNPKQFEVLLKRELSLLHEWFGQRAFSDYSHQIGYEIELLLLDSSFAPACKNIEFIKQYNPPLLMSEVHRAQIEFATNHFLLDGNLFTETESHFNELLDSVYRLEENILMMGTYPGPIEGLGNIEQLTDEKRYRTLDEALRRERGGRAAQFEIDDWSFKSDSLSLNGLCSALHIHLRVTQEQSTSYYTAAQVAAGPILAACCNSPYFDGKELWEETRVPLFEQGLSMKAIFGDGERSFLDLFEENMDYRHLLTIADPSLPAEKLFHLREQNSVSYRWNRPRVDFDVYGTPHLRIEFRSLPSGPTCLDMVANAAFFVGAVAELSHHSPEKFISHAKENFYAAAKKGLSATLHWDKPIDAPTLILETFIPLASQGLKRLKVDDNDSKRLLHIIEERVKTGQTGSVWQKNWIYSRGKDFPAMIKDYIRNQKQGHPVHTWSLR